MFQNIKKTDNLKVDDVLGLVDIEPKKNKTGDDIVEIHRLQVDTSLIDIFSPIKSYVSLTTFLRSPP